MLSFANDANDLKASYYLDYSTSAEQIYTSLAAWSIHKCSNLDILGEIAGQPGRFHASLSSWVPDWSVAPDAYPFNGKMDQTDHHSRPLFTTSGKCSPDIAHVSTFAPNIVFVIRLRCVLGSFAPSHATIWRYRARNPVHVATELGVKSMPS